MPPRLITYGTAAAVFLLDRLTKSVIEERVSVWDTLVVIPNFFSIVNTQNRGAVFGLLSGADPAWRTLFLMGLAVLALVLVTGLLWQPSRRNATRSRSLRLGLALVLGGAAGNVYDRIVSGSVTDFLDFYVGDHHWPAFNVADSAITIGVALFLFDMWRSRRRGVQA